MEFRWVLNSSPVVASENGISIVKLNQRTSTLSINSVEAMHRGIFKCIAINKAGISEHTAELHVNGLFICFFFFILFDILQDFIDFRIILLITFFILLSFTLFPFHLNKNSFVKSCFKASMDCTEN